MVSWMKADKADGARGREKMAGVRGRIDGRGMTSCGGGGGGLSARGPAG